MTEMPFTGRPILRPTRRDVLGGLAAGAAAFALQPVAAAAAGTATASDGPFHRPIPSSGVLLPAVGLGTWMIPNDSAGQAVEAAVAHGYRHIDTAQAYANEAGVGDGVRKRAGMEPGRAALGGRERAGVHRALPGDAGGGGRSDAREAGCAGGEA